MSTNGLIGRPITRRTFMETMGALGVAAGLGGGAVKIFTDAPEAMAAATVSNAVGACKICGSECSYIAKKNGSHFELFGNPNTPTDNIWGDGKGRMCVKGYSGADKALNPDRVFFPMKRTNPNKGRNEDPRFVRISWEEAYSLAAQKLNETVAQYGSKAVMVLSRGNDWSNRFQPALGTPNKMGHQSTCFTTHTWAWPALVPQVAKGGRSWTHDYGNATYLLSFGHDQVGRAQNPTVQGVIKALENGAKATVFDPRLSITAAKALAYGGRYYPVKPGTDLAIMWAMIKWIVANNKHNSTFISNYVNATDWTQFQAYVNANEFADELAPSATVQDVAEWAAAISQVPAEDILAVAREYTNDGNYSGWRPHMMTHKRDGAGGPNFENSWRAAYAQLVLEILVGSIDRLGGNILDRTHTLRSFNSIIANPTPPVMERDEAGVAYPRVDRRNQWTGASGGQGSFETLTTAVVNDDPYPVRYMLTSYYNFPQNSTHTARTVEAMKKCFVVNHGFYADSGAWMSDILMPEQTTYEKTYISTSGKVQGMSKYAFIKLNEPMFPVMGGKSQAETYHGIARAADTGGGGKFPTWQQAHQAYFNSKSAAWQAQNPSYVSSRDSLSKFCTVDGTPTGQAWSGSIVQNAQLAELASTGQGGWPSNISSLTTFRAQRGWAGDKSGIFPKPSEAPAWVDYSALSTSNRIRLNVQARGGGEYATVPGGGGLIEPFPGWAPARPAQPNPAAGKFMLVVIREPMLIHTESKAEAMMVELSDMGRVEMHPAAAAGLGLVQGDTIRITADLTGATETAVVRITPHIRQDCIMVPHGWGNWDLSASNNEVPSGLGIPTQKFGFNASAGVGADDNAFVTALPYTEQVARRDPSCSAVMTDVILTVTKA